MRYGQIEPAATDFTCVSHVPCTVRIGELLGLRTRGKFRGLLKNELVHHRQRTTREEAKQKISEYIGFLQSARQAGKTGLLVAAALTKRCYSNLLVAYPAGLYNIRQRAPTTRPLRHSPCDSSNPPVFNRFFVVLLNPTFIILQ